LCGTCAAGESCNTTLLRCYPNSCVPSCLGANCGEDGCGGSCGVCASGSSCDYDPVGGANNGICTPYPYCDSYNPSCVGCTATQFCATDCICHNITDPLPDLTVRVTEVKSAPENLLNSSCAVRELCGVPGTNQRFLRFTVRSANVGFADARIPGIKEFPQFFYYSNCHNHWHYTGYARYRLYDLNDQIMSDGGKESYCLEDSGPLFQAPWVECSSFYDCGNQGIQRGWTDEYSYTLDCQWLSITGIAPGYYKLEILVNFERHFHEYSFDNNHMVMCLKLTNNDASTQVVANSFCAGAPYKSTSSSTAVSLLAAILSVVLCFLN